MISDTADTAAATRAWNITPAVAVIRPDSGASSALIVWERRAPVPFEQPLSSVQALYFCARPDTGDLPPVTRMELAAPQQIADGVLRAPSVVGTDSGYCVAWGSPTGIRLVALRDTVLPSTGWPHGGKTL